LIAATRQALLSSGARAERPHSRLTRFDVAFLTVAVAVATWLLLLGRDLTFHSDEWTLLAFPPPLTDIPAWFAPHNEHWSTLLYVVYLGANAVFGLSSYLPYLAVLVGLHLVATAGLYRLLGRIVGPLPALVGSLLMLLLGSAYQDLLWAFQIGFVGSTAAGLWSMVLLTGARRRHAVAAVLLSASLAFSGIGLAFLTAGSVLGVSEGSGHRGRRWLAVPFALYAIWFVAFGRSAVSVNNDVFSLDAVRQAIPSIALGTVGAVSSTFGLSFLVGAIATVIGGLMLAWSWAQAVATQRDSASTSNATTPARRVETIALPIASLAGLLVLYSLIGLTRAQLGEDAILQSRYVYSAAPLVLVLAASVAAASVGARDQLRSVRHLGLLAVALVALNGNLRLLQNGLDVFHNYAIDVRASIAVLVRYQDAPNVDLSVAAFPYTSRSQLLALVTRERWPVEDPSALPAANVDSALRELVHRAFRWEAYVNPDGQVEQPPEVRSVSGGVAITSNDCSAIRSFAPIVDAELVVPDGSALKIEASPGSTVQAWFGRFAQPAGDPLSVSIPSTGAATLSMPNLADGRPWLVSITADAPAGSWNVETWTFCLL
jgi:hypothetical protein